jgi:hypothetical protein
MFIQEPDVAVSVVEVRELFLHRSQGRLGTKAKGVARPEVLRRAWYPYKLINTPFQSVPPGIPGLLQLACAAI